MENLEGDIDALIEGLLNADRDIKTIEEKLRLLYRVFGLLSPFRDTEAALSRIELISRKLGLRSEPSIILEAYREYLLKT